MTKEILIASAIALLVADGAMAQFPYTSPELKHLTSSKPLTPGDVRCLKPFDDFVDFSLDTYKSGDSNQQSVLERIRIVDFPKYDWLPPTEAAAKDEVRKTGKVIAKTRRELPKDKRTLEKNIQNERTAQGKARQFAQIATEAQRVIVTSLEITLQMNEAYNRTMKCVLETKAWAQ